MNYWILYSILFVLDSLETNRALRASFVRRVRGLTKTRERDHTQYDREIDIINQQRTHQHHYAY